jgi:hypothetical protein
MPSSVNIGASSTNVCGAAQLTFTLIKKTSGCGNFAITISPNPAQDALAVETVPVNSAQSTADMPLIDEVNLVNANQNTVISSTAPSNKVVLNVKALTKGDYVLRVRVGDETFAYHVVIQ